MEVNCMGTILYIHSETCECQRHHILASFNSRPFPPWPVFDRLQKIDYHKQINELSMQLTSFHRSQFAETSPMGNQMFFTYGRETLHSEERGRVEGHVLVCSKLHSS